MTNPVATLISEALRGSGGRLRPRPFAMIHLTCRYCGAPITAAGASCHWRTTHRGKITYNGKSIR